MLFWFSKTAFPWYVRKTHLGRDTTGKSLAIKVKKLCGLISSVCGSGKQTRIRIASGLVRKWNIVFVYQEACKSQGQGKVLMPKFRI
jgi:hypothetical protein